jgi:hypothetical protein
MMLTFSLIIIAKAAPETCIYEGERCLFNDTICIQALDDLVLNETWETISFNYSASNGGALQAEDATTYTDNGGSYIEVNSATEVEMIDVDLDTTNYIYYDYGENNIVDFHAQMDIQLGPVDRNGRAYAFSFCNETDSWDGITDGVGCRLRRSTRDGEYQISLVTKESGVTNVYTYGWGSTPPTATFAVDMYKVNTDIWLEIYSNAGRGTLLGNVSASLTDSHRYRYAYWGQTDNVAVPARALDALLQNFKFRGTGITSGTYYTPNLLEGKSNQTVGVIYDAFIDEDNEIYAQVS